MVRDAVAANPRTVVVLQTMGPVDLRPFAARARALLWSSYNGMRQGEALADVLLGAVDPSGHLPFTWYRDDSQLPPIEDYAIRGGGGRPGRTYQYFDGAAAYPFGFGLGYTTFRYTGARVDHATTDPDGTVTATVTVTNSGPRAGTAVVQLYAASPPASERPRQRLLGFRPVTLGAGESARVELPVRVRDLAFFDQRAGRFAVDPGRYELRFGGSSADRAATVTTTVAGPGSPTPSVLTAAPRAATDPAGGRGRVAFPSGVTVEPQLTVAMSDDTLRGYLDPTHGGPLPPGAVLTYQSNRPSVVAVDGGAVRTVGRGVATVTASLTLGGATVVTEFVVTVG
jgi:beta-glucosidase